MILGTGGELESGKSTTANILVNKYGFVEKSFARNLKEMCIHVFGVTSYQVYDTEGKKEILHPSIILSQEHVAGIVKWAIEKNGFDVTEEMIADISKYIGKELLTPRMILQFVGTEILRHGIDDAYHIVVVAREIHNENLNNVVVSDARFSNERSWIRTQNGFNILVYDPHTPKKTGNVHESEMVGSPEDYDYTIVNDKTLGLKQLQRTVHMVAHMLDLPDSFTNYSNSF